MVETAKLESHKQRLFVTFEAEWKFNVKQFTQWTQNTLIYDPRNVKGYDIQYESSIQVSFSSSLSASEKFCEQFDCVFCLTGTEQSL